MNAPTPHTGNYLVLVIEDGDEYMTNLTTFVASGFSYVQARSGARACRMVREHAVDLVYLDMRFDRTPLEDLIGDIVALTGRFNGDVGRARRFQQDNQGLFILRELRAAGWMRPIVLSYDFAREEQRFAALTRNDPALHYCPDYADAATIRRTMRTALGVEEEG